MHSSLRGAVHRISIRTLLIGVLGTLLLVFMTAEIAHSHPQVVDSSTAIHCQLCATAHLATASQPAWLTSFVLHLIGTVDIGEPTRGSRIVIRTALIRPPPFVGSSVA